MNYLLKLIAAIVTILCLARVADGAPRPKPRTTPEAEFAKELQRFPDASTCWDYVTLASHHLDYIDNRMSLEPHNINEWMEYRAQVVFWHDVWVKLAYARDKWYHLTYRQECLQEVREIIGEPAYNIGFVWPPVAAHMMIICDEPPDNAIVTENAVPPS